MDTENPGSSAWRQMLTVVACLVVTALVLAVWYWLKIHTLGTWIEMSFFFMPIVIGLAVGWVTRRCSPEGGFRVASFAVALTLLAGLAGMAVQHRITVDCFLRRVVAAVYEETLDYAKTTVLAENDEQLRPVLSSREIAVVGRLAAGVTNEPALSYEQKRNLIHVNWIISRRQVLRRSPLGGIQGMEAPIWEATRIVPDAYYLDELIAKLVKEPVADGELVRFRNQELPGLKQLVDNRMPRRDFEQSLVALTESRMSWNSLAFQGLGPLSGICIAAGVMIAYYLARQPEDNELI
jgi:hypothetical protein